MADCSGRTCGNHDTDEVKLMDKLQKLLTDAKFISALAVVIASVSAVFGVDWTATGIEQWIAETVGIITAFTGGLYALKRVADQRSD